MEKARKATAASAGAKPPRPRDLRSAGADVARAVAAMPKPTKMEVVLNETGGSDALKVSKALRGGERVLSSRVNRFEGLAELGDAADLAAAAPAVGPAAVLNAAGPNANA